MARSRSLAFAGTLVLAVPAPTLIAQAPAATAPLPQVQTGVGSWTIDVTHSELTFRIRHMMSRVRGGFGTWSGTIVADPAAWQDGSVEVTIDTRSIDTGNERRDNHLRSGDFFAADSFPTMTFRSTRIERDGDGAKIDGILTIRGVSRPVVLDATFLGIAPERRGDRIGFEAKTAINRLDYGVAWNRAAEAGGVVLGDEVEITIQVEAVRARS
jgi:polyisoprenoid-binding protein YceI